MATTPDTSFSDIALDALALLRRQRFTEDEFLAWLSEQPGDVRAEWVNGEVIMMSPANVEHNDLNVWLTAILKFLVDRGSLGKVFSDVYVRLPNRPSRRIPDLMFVSRDRQHLLRTAHLDGAPELIMELVSPDSVARDWREKYLEYEAAGVREYWVIDLQSRYVEAYLLADGKYQPIVEREAYLHSTALTGLRLKTEWFWPETRPDVISSLRELGIIS